MIKISHRGDFKKTFAYFDKLSKSDIKNLDYYGRLGVQALQQNTPKRTGKTANSWTYEISKEKNRISITWKNTNVVNNVPIAIVIQYGHATRNGGFVQGIDYINPAMRPVFEEIAKSAWKEVTRL